MDKASQVRLRVEIGGIRCDGCRKRVRAAVSAVASVTGVTIESAPDRAEVLIAPEAKSKVVAAIQGAGYKVVGVSSSPA